MAIKEAICVVLGGAGFIGSHVAKSLRNEKWKGTPIRVRVVDRRPRNLYMDQSEYCDEFIQSDVRDKLQLETALEGATIVLHFAADMGGMGFIDHDNGPNIMAQNSVMCNNVATLCAESASIEKLLYASSACVYPAQEQNEYTGTKLAEGLAWQGAPADLYGLEKLVSEKVFEETCCNRKIELSIVRYHNVYGEHGTWFGGREKAPAALMRKALTTPSGQPMEIWGNGQQVRSFLHVDDAVRGTIQLLKSKYAKPVNIGSEEHISIRDLATLALRVAQRSDVQLHFTDGPEGVPGRCSDNTLVTNLLGWEPRISLSEGMGRLCRWMQGELAEMNDVERAKLCSSERPASVAPVQKRWGVLLPVTSRNLGRKVLDNVDGFLTSLRNSITDAEKWETDVKLYIAVDRDDPILSVTAAHRPNGDGEERLTLSGSPDLHRTLSRFGFSYAVRECDYEPGKVCWIWRDLARDAYCDACDYYVLFGDDIRLRSAGWMSRIHREFLDIHDSSSQTVPRGFGCVAFRDMSFPGFPTFPVVSRQHMRMFDGNIFPAVFHNQDADPYLYDLYRPWQASRYVSDAMLTNEFGGPNAARYEKKHTQWTGRILDSGIEHVHRWLSTFRYPAERCITLDVAVPSYRVDMNVLKAILELPVPDGISVRWIVIIDNPTETVNYDKLCDLYGQTPSYRIRMNKENLGAAATRTRAIEESTADWILFLDDDVVPSGRLLHAYKAAIDAHPTAAGFAGPTYFPEPATLAQKAIVASGVTTFWDYVGSMKLSHSTEVPVLLPWAVTANVLMRRIPGVTFRDDVGFPKTGGGEDIDYILQVKKNFPEYHGSGRNRVSPPLGSCGSHRESGELVHVPHAHCTHPYWSGGVAGRCWKRFYGWASGDGRLSSLYTEFAFRSAPNGVEFLTLLSVALLVALVISTLSIAPSTWWTKAPLAHIAPMLLLSVFLCDLCFVMMVCCRPRAFALGVSGSTPLHELLVCLEAALIVQLSEFGRMLSHLRRCDFAQLCNRFDWFTAQCPAAVKDERRNHALRTIAMCTTIAVVLAVV